VLHTGQVPDVRLNRHAPTPEFLDQPPGLGEIFLAGHRIADRVERRARVDRDDVGALTGKAQRVAAALSPCGAGDEGDLALDSTTHDYSSILSARSGHVATASRAAASSSAGMSPSMSGSTLPLSSSPKTSGATKLHRVCSAHWPGRT